MRGQGGDPPTWAVVLDMAGGDVLKAQQMEAELSAEWWQRGRVWVNAQAKARDK